MKRLFLAMAIILFAMGTAGAADSRQYNGTWINTDTNTNGLTKVVVKGAGGKASVHVWGKCSPQDCDWGWLNCNSYADGHLSTHYRSDLSVRNLTITMPNPGTLTVQMHTHFIDNSGRPDQDATYSFKRVFTPVQQAPKPLGGLQVKPPSDEPTGKY
ncbi:MAG TPA: hypothetical protein PKY89_16290 [Deltaproteobacteria bacterium]|nr:hypothetical protein [Deltaproteobacteria bacterium]